MSLDVELVFQEKIADLPHLIRLGLSASGLNVDDFLHAVTGKDAVAPAPRAAGEAGALQDEAEILEAEVRIGAAFEKFADGFPNAAHRGTFSILDTTTVMAGVCARRIGRAGRAVQRIMRFAPVGNWETRIRIEISRDSAHWSG